MKTDLQKINDILNKALPDRLELKPRCKLYKKYESKKGEWVYTTDHRIVTAVFGDVYYTGGEEDFIIHTSKHPISELNTKGYTHNLGQEPTIIDVLRVLGQQKEISNYSINLSSSKEWIIEFYREDFDSNGEFGVFLFAEVWFDLAKGDFLKDQKPEVLADLLTLLK